MSIETCKNHNTAPEKDLYWPGEIGISKYNLLRTHWIGRKTKNDYVQILSKLLQSAEEKRKGFEKLGSMPATELGSKCFGCYTRFFQGRYLTLITTTASFYSQSFTGNDWL